MGGSTRYPWALAAEIGDSLVQFLTACEAVDRAMVVGSVRRRKETVGDVEILYIPHFEPEPDCQSLFAELVPVNQADKAIRAMLTGGVLRPRPNSLGRDTWGDLIKLAVHVETGLPVDLFAANEANWFNQLVCRTGPADSNAAIAKAAHRRGLLWKPTGPGFESRGGTVYPAKSEEDVFRLAALAYVEPERRK